MTTLDRTRRQQVIDDSNNNTNDSTMVESAMNGSGSGSAVGNLPM